MATVEDQQLEFKKKIKVLEYGFMLFFLHTWARGEKH